MENDVALDRISTLFVQLDESSFLTIPKYQKVCEVIRKLIEHAELKPGHRLPPESVLAKKLSISLGTIQKALNTLSTQGFLNRVQGRGTFIAASDAQLVDLWHFRFIDHDGKRLKPVYTQVLSIDKMRNEGPWTEFLGKDKFYILISRLIDIDHECQAISQFYLRGNRFSSLFEEKTENLEGVLLRNVIKEKFDLPTISFQERIAAERFPDLVCKWLELPFYSIGLVCHIRGYTYRKAPLSFQQLFVPPNTKQLEFKETNPFGSN